MCLGSFCLLNLPTSHKIPCCQQDMKREVRLKAIEEESTLAAEIDEIESHLSAVKDEHARRDLSHLDWGQCWQGCLETVNSPQNLV